MANATTNRYAMLAKGLTWNDVGAWLNKDGDFSTRYVKFNETTLRSRERERVLEAKLPAGQKIPKLPRQSVMQDLSRTNSADNETSRQIFLQFVLKECGVKSKEELPQNIRAAMKLDGGKYERHDWDEGKGRKLSGRRVSAVMTAVLVQKKLHDSIKANFPKKFSEEKFKTDIKNFWVGMNGDLKKKLLDPLNHATFRRLFTAYYNSSDQYDFCDSINTLYAKSIKEKSNLPIPAGLYSFTGPGKDSVGSCFMSQLNSSKIPNGDESGVKKTSFDYLIHLFSREQSTLTIKIPGGIRDVSRVAKLEWREDNKVAFIGSDGRAKIYQCQNKKQLEELKGCLKEQLQLQDDEKLLVLLSKTLSSGVQMGGKDTRDVRQDAIGAYMRKNHIGLPDAKYAFEPRTDTAVTVHGPGRYSVNRQTVSKILSFSVKDSGMEYSVEFPPDSMAEVDLSFKYDLRGKGQEPKASGFKYRMGFNFTGVKDVKAGQPGDEVSAP